ncbi:MAG: hypothetical protein WCC37_18000 [Candidatus Sulfotelmatobacter sp.]
MPETPLPHTLPGDFCVLKYEDTEYRLLVDDEDVSSFRLGTNLERIMTAFRRYSQRELLLEGLDAAREFGAAQVIFHDNTIIRIHAPEKKRDLDWSGFDDNSAPKAISLPSLA